MDDDLLDAGQPAFLDDAGKLPRKVDADGAAADDG